MTEYMILDDAGNALASFSDEVTAHATLHAIVAVEPDAAEHVVLLAYDDDGMPIGDALSVWDVPMAVTIQPSDFVQSQQTEARVKQSSRRQTRYVGGMMSEWQVRWDKQARGFPGPIVAA